MLLILPLPLPPLDLLLLLERFTVEPVSPLSTCPTVCTPMGAVLVRFPDSEAAAFNVRVELSSVEAEGMLSGVVRGDAGEGVVADVSPGSVMQLTALAALSLAPLFSDCLDRTESRLSPLLLDGLSTDSSFIVVCRVSEAPLIVLTRLL